MILLGLLVVFACWAARCFADEQLFAVLGIYGCADSLYYGPKLLTTSGTADGDYKMYFSTNTASKQVPHDTWLQIVTQSDGAAELFRIYWIFETEKTLEQRFVAAVNTGETVSYRVVDAATHKEYAYSGTWRFSSAALMSASKFSVATTTCCFSGDGGAWGAGNGVINAYDNEYGYEATSFWGVGNWDGQDGCSVVYKNGVRFANYGTGVKTYMYYDVELPPSAEPSAAPSNPSASPTTLPPTTSPSVLPAGQPILFAVVGGQSCAGNLYYGPQAITTSGSADGLHPYFLSTSNSLAHTQWLQIVTSDGTNELFRIYWTFDTARTVEGHFTTAVSQGVAVSFVVYDASSSLEYTSSGTWWFSSSAAITSSTFAVATTQYGFSTKDGIWGAFTGVGDPNNYMQSDSISSKFWGVGTWYHWDDTYCFLVYRDGYVYNTDHRADVKSFMYYLDAVSPTQVPTAMPTRPTPLPSPSPEPTVDPTTSPTEAPSCSPISEPTPYPTYDRSAEVWQLFAVLGGSACAEKLYYGPQPVTRAGSADGYATYLSTRTPGYDTPHDTWEQVVTSDGTTELFRIIWRFSSMKTLAQRISNAVVAGEPVAYTVTDAGGAVYTYSGVWWFSSRAGAMQTKFETSVSTCCFSANDGMWGAGGGIIKPTFNSFEIGFLHFWGIGNWYSTDSDCAKIYRQGTSSWGVATARTYMYYYAPAVPTSEPSVRPTLVPTAAPTARPTLVPTAKPTIGPALMPTVSPTANPAVKPTSTPAPTRVPTRAPTPKPTLATAPPATVSPSALPTDPTVPTSGPTPKPSCAPTRPPTRRPTARPTRYPTARPTVRPTKVPTGKPTITAFTAGDTLFAVVGGDACAENLYYGPQAITAAGSADGLHPYFLSTATASRDTPHQYWTQIVTSDGATELFRIYWTFDTPRTLADHIITATTQGVAVSYRVETPAGGVYTYEGTWWFSDVAHVTSAKFATTVTSVGFSADAGAWGAGSGTIQANGNSGYSLAHFWGVGNWDSIDNIDNAECSKMYMDGVAYASYGANTKTYMYYSASNDSTGGPTLAPTQAPTIAAPSIPTRPSTARPTRRPTGIPTARPSFFPTALPTARPTNVGTVRPTFSDFIGGGTLFAVVGGDACAENLFYGPQAITTAGSADGLHPYFLSTATAARDTPHQHWTQVVTSDGATELFRIYWTFDTPRTLADHFIAATTQGVTVSYRVETPAGGVYTYAGTWWFSNGAQVTTAKFATYEVLLGFSADDGVWGAGSGTMQPNKNANGYISTLFWGVGNWGGVDDTECHKIYMEGAAYADYGPNTKTYMYFTRAPSSSPSAVPSMAPAPVVRMVVTQVSESLCYIVRTSASSVAVRVLRRLLFYYVLPSQQIQGASFDDYVLAPTEFENVIYDAITFSLMVNKEDIRDLTVLPGDALTRRRASAVDDVFAKKLRGAQQPPATLPGAAEHLHEKDVDPTHGASVRESADDAVSTNTVPTQSPAAASVQGEASTRRRSSGDGQLATGDSVLFTYSIVLSSNQRTFQALQQQLLQSVNSGTFDANLQTQAASYGVPALTTVTTAVVSAEDNSPTESEDDENGGGSSAALTLPVVVGIAVGAGALIAVAVTAFYFCCRPATGELLALLLIVVLRSSA
jgi:hypothetical protein